MRRVRQKTNSETNRKQTRTKEVAYVVQVDLFPEDFELSDFVAA